MRIQIGFTICVLPVTWAQNTGGTTGCPCLGTGDNSPRAQQLEANAAKECEWTASDWLSPDDEDSTTMTCLLAEVPAGSDTYSLYPESYGANCYIHKEVGHRSCFYMPSTDNDGVLPGSVRLQWTGVSIADVLDAITPPKDATDAANNGDGRTKLTLPQDLAGDAQTDLHALCASGTCPRDASCTDGVCPDCEEGLDSCDIDLYNDNIDDDTQKLASKWCGDMFCYVDPCACDSDNADSDYFPSVLAYSYTTCSSAANYASEENRDENAAADDCNADASGALRHGVELVAIATIVASLWQNS
jgi:hypothetical protein